MYNCVTQNGVFGVYLKINAPLPLYEWENHAVDASVMIATITSMYHMARGKCHDMRKSFDPRRGILPWKEAWIKWSPLPEPMLTQIFDAIWRDWAIISNWTHPVALGVFVISKAGRSSTVIVIALCAVLCYIGPRYVEAIRYRLYDIWLKLWTFTKTSSLICTFWDC